MECTDPNMILPMMVAMVGMMRAPQKSRVAVSMSERSGWVSVGTRRFLPQTETHQNKTVNKYTTFKKD